MRVARQGTLYPLLARRVRDLDLPGSGCGDTTNSGDTTAAVFLRVESSSFPLSSAVHGPTWAKCRQRADRPLGTRSCPKVPFGEANPYDLWNKKQLLASFRFRGEAIPYPYDLWKKSPSGFL